MKYLITFSFAILFCLSGYSQNKKPVYDSLLAKKLHADDYGMKNYVLVILKTGIYKPKNKRETDSLFTGHMNNIKRLADEGKLAVAGPFEKNDASYRGLFIFNVETIEEAKKLCELDPAVNAKLFALDFYPWYSSAALLEVSEIHKRLQKKSY